MGVIIIIVGIMLIIAHKTRGRKRKIGLPGMGSPIGNVSVMMEESSLDGKLHH